MTIETIAVIIADAGVIIGAISAAFIWGRRIVEGLRCQLRADMLNTYYKCKDAQKIRQYEAEHFEKCYHAYKALKGNSFIDEIYNKAHKWEVIS